MIRLLAIPVAGTILALCVVLLAHPARQGEKAPHEVKPPELPPWLEKSGEEEVPEPLRPPERAPEPTPPPTPQTFQLELESDGSFLDLETNDRYTDLDDLVAQLHPEVKHTIMLTNAAGVPASALDAAVTNLSAHYTVRRIERAPDK